MISKADLHVFAKADWFQRQRNACIGFKGKEMHIYKWQKNAYCLGLKGWLTCGSRCCVRSSEPGKASAPAGTASAATQSRRAGSRRQSRPSACARQRPRAGRTVACLRQWAGRKNWYHVREVGRDRADAHIHVYVYVLCYTQSRNLCRSGIFLRWLIFVSTTQRQT